MFLKIFRNIFCVQDTRLVSATNIARVAKPSNIWETWSRQQRCRHNVSSFCRPSSLPLSSPAANRAWPTPASSRTSSHTHGELPPCPLWSAANSTTWVWCHPHWCCHGYTCRFSSRPRWRSQWHWRSQGSSLRRRWSLEQAEGGPLETNHANIEIINAHKRVKQATIVCTDREGLSLSLFFFCPMCDFRDVRIFQLLIHPAFHPSISSCISPSIKSETFDTSCTTDVASAGPKADGSCVKRFQLYPRTFDL